MYTTGQESQINEGGDGEEEGYDGGEIRIAQGNVENRTGTNRDKQQRREESQSRRNGKGMPDIFYSAQVLLFLFIRKRFCFFSSGSSSYVLSPIRFRTKIV